MLHTLLVIIQLFCAIGIVALVLLQRGKGADAGAGFGAGASGTVFGARGATTALSRATAILAAVFMVTSLTLGYLSSHGGAATQSNSLLDKLSTQPAAPPPVTPAPQIATPGAPPAPPAAGSGSAAGAASSAPQAAPATPVTPATPGTAPPAAGGAGGAH